MATVTTRTKIPPRVVPVFDWLAEPRKFSFTSEDEFRAWVSRRHGTVRLRPFSSSHDVMLDERGLVQGRYRYTQVALLRMCRTLCPGLGDVVVSLLREAHLNRRDQAPVALAIRTINDMVKLRFRSMISEWRFVTDLHEGRIEGIVGPRYALYSNHDMYTCTAVFLGGRYRFSQAAVNDSRMVLTFTADEPHCVMSGKNSDRFYRGIYVVNSEIGETSVKAASTLTREFDGTRCMRPFEDVGRATHLRGRQFNQELRKMLLKLQETHISGSDLLKRIQILSERPVPLPQGKELDMQQRNALIKPLMKHMLNRRPPAERTLMRLLRYGSYHRKAEKGYNSQVARNQYDLFNAITSLARSQKRPTLSQEFMEQLAYRILVGEITIY